jgi:NitT/TauT family transport system permease protein
MSPRDQRWLFPVLGLLVLGAVWYALRHVIGLPQWLLPLPHEIVEAMWRDRAVFVAATWQTTQSALFGFLAAAVGGLVLAVAMASTRWLRLAFFPYLLVLQLTPVVVIAPLIILWAGRGTTSIVIVTFIVSFFPVVVNTTHGMVSTDSHLMELFEVWNARRWQRILLLQLPSALPFYFAGLRIAAALAPIGAIFGEYVTGTVSGGTGGLGFMVQVYNMQQKRAELMGTGVACCLLGFVFLAIIAALNRLLLRHWHDSFVAADR